MSVLGWIIGILLGAGLGELNQMPISGALVGGLIGNLLLVQSGLNAALRKAVAEVASLKALIEQQKDFFVQELNRLRSLPPAAPPTAANMPATPPATAPTPAAHPADSVAAASHQASARDARVDTAAPRPQAAALSPLAPSATANPAPSAATQTAPPPPPPSTPAPRPIKSPPKPPSVREPGTLARLIGAARAWLFGGNTLVRMGAVLVFLGFGFLLRYASDYVVVPIELRYLGVVGAAMAALWLGWRLRQSRPAYALLLQGVAVAVMYLSVFAAMRLHQILPLGPGMALLVCIAALSAMLALLQNAMSLAVAGTLGGFAAPLLASTGGGSHVALFSYLALLNAGILSIAWFRAWRPLNLIGFFGTSAIGSLWAARSYEAEHYLSCQLFLLLFFLMFVLIGLLFARRQLLDSGNTPPAGASKAQWLAWIGQQSLATRYIDGSLMFGPPLVGFGLQYALLEATQYGAALSALLLGAFYMGLAWQLFKHTRSALRLLIEVYLALGIIFASLAIPLGLDAQWTTAVWAIEAAGIYWLGVRQNRSVARAFALLLQLAAILVYLAELGWGEAAVLSGSALGAAVLAAAFLCNALSLRQALHSHATMGWDSRLRPLFNTLGLCFAYLLAPLLLSLHNTAMAWSLAGLLSIVLGLRWRAPSWLANGLFIQVLAGALFLSGTQGTEADSSGAVLGMAGAGSAALLQAAGIGLLALLSTSLAIRRARQDADPALERRAGWLMLFGLGFVALAALFALPWASSAAVWAGCGCLLLCLALWLQLRPAFWFALGLEALAGGTYLLKGADAVATSELADAHLAAFGHSAFWVPLVIATAAFLAAWRLVAVDRRSAPATAPTLSLHAIALPLMLWAALWWASAWWPELSRLLLPQSLARHAFLGLIALSALALNRVASQQSWAVPVWLGSAVLPLAWLCFGLDALNRQHPFAQWGWLAALLTAAAHLYTLRNSALLRSGLAKLIHLLGIWTLLYTLSLASRQSLIDISTPGSAWRWLGWVLPLCAWLIWAARDNAATRWPAVLMPKLYRFGASLPIVLLLFGWVWLAAMGSAGDSAPLAYLPLLNPLEITLMLALICSAQWLRQAFRAQPDFAGLGEPIRWALYALCFIVYSTTVLRAVHHFGALPWALQTMLQSMLAQASLSIAWASLALALMIFGYRRAQRAVWIIGAALVGVVVAKMFFIELSNRGGLERIVSFIGVGVLLLVVGYFAPLPPAKESVSE